MYSLIKGRDKRSPGLGTYPLDYMTLIIMHNVLSHYIFIRAVLAWHVCTNKSDK